jgi:hypothetical protein
LPGTELGTVIVINAKEAVLVFVGISDSYSKSDDTKVVVEDIRTVLIPLVFSPKQVPQNAFAAIRCGPFAILIS